MAVSRDQVMQALFDLLKVSSSFVTVGRRLVDPENVASDEKPAFFLVEHEDEFKKDLPDQPLVQTMTALAFLYIDTGTDQILGAHLLGPGYSELINTFGLAIKLGLTTRQLRSTTATYPSIGSDLGSLL